MRTAVALCAMLLAASVGAQSKRELNVWVGKNVAPSQKIRLQINTKNVPVVHIEAFRIKALSWLRPFEEDRKRPTVSGSPVMTWDVTVADRNQAKNPNQADTYYSRQTNLPPMNPGVYCLIFKGGGKEAWEVVNVTHLSVVMKRSPYRTLVWVTDALQGRVISNAKVTLFSRRGQSIFSGTTKSDGSLFFPIGPGEQSVVIQSGSDFAGLSSSASDPNGHLLAHFQTDRPIYRPGQKVSFKAILRRTLGTGYTPDSGKECTVQIRDPKDNPLDELKLISNKMGTVAGEFELPEEGMTGPYSLVLKTGKDSAYATLTVAEYRKPEFKVTAKPVAARYLSGDTVQFTVEAAYYYGSPVQNGAVRYQIRRTPSPYGYRDPSEDWFYSGDGNLYPSDTYGGAEFVADDTAYTDNEGKLTISVKSDPKRGDDNYSLTCTVMDQSRRQVEAGASVQVYAAAIRIGMSTPLVYATLGSLIPINVRVVDLDGKPASANIAFELKIAEWDDKKGEWKERVLTTTKSSVSKSGSATIKLPAKEAGDLIIYASAPDGSGRTARARYSVWVAGNFKPAKKQIEQPTVELKLDRRTYRPGDTVTAYASTNTPGLPILLTMEGDDIWNYKVVVNPNRGQSWAVATNPKFSPNAYVSVIQWVKGRQVQTSSVVPLPDPAKALKIEISPNKTDYRPGEQAQFWLKVRDSFGNPAKAEVAIGVVDEAIFALSPDVTPDLYRWYWGIRSNHVATFLSAPEEISGGAYQRVNSLAPIRQRFEDTAFWGPMVTTDDKGEASVQFEMPGNLTAWRATARGVTLVTAVGSAVSTVRANRPVTLRLATPRQMVVGDRIWLIGTVDNRSATKLEFEARLDVRGLSLKSPATQKIEIGPKTQAKVQWEVEAVQVGSATLTGQVEAAGKDDPDYADALRVPLRIVPKGLMNRLLGGGAMEKSATVEIGLPKDRIEPASSLQIEIRAGVTPKLNSLADEVLRNPRFGTLGAANQLDVAAAMGLPTTAKQVKESLALLSRNINFEGWGWWEKQPANPIVTARALAALAHANHSGIRVFDNLLNAGRGAAVARFNATNLWEHRALLGSAAWLSGEKKGEAMVREVLERGLNLSPLARLKLAEALDHAGDKSAASSVTQSVLEQMSDGPTEAYMPTGEGIGWASTDVESTSQAVMMLSRLGLRPELQTRMVRWLTSSSRGWLSLDENAAMVRALSEYLKHNKEASKLGNLGVSIGSQSFEVLRSKFGELAIVNVPTSTLSDNNKVVITRDGDGQVFFDYEARVFLPSLHETTEGVRVLRRYEVRNSAGVWVELDRNVKPAEPVRCTIVAWGDDLDDAVKINEPIPAGFEFVEEDLADFAYQEIRDGAVVHYLTNSGTPRVFRYFLRAETEGTLTALPATAEYLRRPANRGQSVPVHMVVKQ